MVALDVFGLIVIVGFLGGGSALTIYGARLLRRGDEVTAEDAVRWRHRAKNLGFDASPEMNPNITDVLVRAWRSLSGWLCLSAGFGALLAGVVGGGFYILHVIHVSAQDFQDWAVFGIALVGAGTVAMAACGGIGLMVGFSRVRRDARAADQPSRRLRDYRPIYVACYPLVVLICDVVLMTVLVQRLAPTLHQASLARAFALQNMWVVPAAPAILLAALICLELLVRWIVALPPLMLPQDASIGQRADEHMRQWGVWRCYTLFQFALTAAVLIPFFLLNMIPRSPGSLPDSLYKSVPSLLIEANVDIWFGLFSIFLISALLNYVLMPSARKNTTLAVGQAGSDQAEAIQGVE